MISECHERCGTSDPPWDGDSLGSDAVRDVGGIGRECSRHRGFETATSWVDLKLPAATPEWRAFKSLGCAPLPSVQKNGAEGGSGRGLGLGTTGLDQARNADDAVILISIIPTRHFKRARGPLSPPQARRDLSTAFVWRRGQPVRD